MVKDLYCADNGRPALDPTLMFKLLLLGYLFGVRSERQLIREVQVNVAYRWFLGLSLTDKVPDASTLSQNRRRRFNDSDVYQQIFDQIVFQAMKRSLVSGHVLYTDSTHLKANANKGKWVRAQALSERQAYLDELDRAVLARLQRQKDRFGFKVSHVGHWGKVIYRRRKETVERSFADAKELRQYRYARYRGRDKVQAQCLLTAAAQNIKKIALLAG